MATSVSRVKMVPDSRRYGNQRGVGERVGVFKLLERDDVRVVAAKMIPNVDVHFNYVSGARGEDQHDNHGEQDGQPPATHDERYGGVQIHVDMLTHRQVSSISSPSDPSREARFRP